MTRHHTVRPSSYDTYSYSGMLWLDVEGPDYWYSSCQDNINFIATLADTAKARGVRVGIYTSNSQWGPIACDSDGFGEYPLWYVLVCSRTF